MATESRWVSGFIERLDKELKKTSHKGFVMSAADETTTACTTPPRVASASNAARILLAPVALRYASRLACAVLSVYLPTTT